MDPPSVPMGSSERGAEIAKHKAPSQCEKILLALRGAGCTLGSFRYLSRDDLIARIPGLTVNAATGRLGPSGPLLVAKGDDPRTAHFAVIGVEEAGRSASGNVVLGYQLTTWGAKQADWIAAHRRTA